MKIVVSALEPSANVHLNVLLSHLQHHDIELCGVFDSNLVQGFQSLHSLAEFAVMGFLGVIGKIPFLRHVQREIVNLAKDADKVLLMDSSSFNLPIAKAIKQHGYTAEVIYYILPQVWIWKPWRAKTLERYCDRLAAIFPFETACYQSKVEFVGNPLLDTLPPARVSPTNSREIAFLPGSRRAEIAYLFPVFAEVAQILRTQGYTTTLIVPAVFQKTDLHTLYGDVSGFQIAYDTPATLQRCDFAFVCSGTATLQAALMGIPFVLAYKARALDYALAAFVVRPRFIGLANIMFDKMGKAPLHVELRQNDVNRDNLLAAFAHADSNVCITAARELRDYLQSGSSQKVAQWLIG